MSALSFGIPKKPLPRFFRERKEAPSEELGNDARKNPTAVNGKPMNSFKQISIFFTLGVALFGMLYVFSVV